MRWVLFGFVALALLTGCVQQPVNPPPLNPESITSLDHLEVGNLNVTGDIRQDEGNMYMNMIHGSFSYFNESGKDFSFNTQDKYYNFSGGNCQYTDNIICEDNGVTKLTINQTGAYRFDYGATGVGANNHFYVTAISVDGEIQNQTRDLIVTDSQQVEKMGGGESVYIEKGDVVTLAIKDSTGTSTGTVYEYNMNARRIGNE